MNPSRENYGTAPNATQEAIMESQDNISARKKTWSSGFFQCFDNRTNCKVTACLPCVTYGQIAEIVDRGKTGSAESAKIYVLGLGPLAITGPTICVMSFIQRVALRGQYGIRGSPYCDCFAHLCCQPCALCQEYRHLEKEGFDMNIGWVANMARREMQNQGTTVAPTVDGPMLR